MSDNNRKIADAIDDINGELKFLRDYVHPDDVAKADQAFSAISDCHEIIQTAADALEDEIDELDKTAKQHRTEIDDLESEKDELEDQIGNYKDLGNPDEVEGLATIVYAAANLTDQQVMEAFGRYLESRKGRMLHVITELDALTNYGSSNR